MKLVLTYEEIFMAISEYLYGQNCLNQPKISNVEIKVFSGKTELVNNTDFSLHAEVEIGT